MNKSKQFLSGKALGRLSGIWWGVLSGASFGLIPLFSLPLLGGGYGVDTVLFYRFSIASLILGLYLAVSRQSFRLSGKQIWQLLVLGVCYLFSSLFLLMGYAYMSAGVATTIHFMYPVFVMLIMMLFFSERVSVVSMGAIVMAVVGVALLSSGDSAAGASGALGVVLVLISSLAYALYIVGIKRFDLHKLGALRLTFFVLTITSVMFLLKATVLGEGIMPLRSGGDVANAVLLALVPTILSNFALVRSIKAIGSIITSILGAMEPMTAVVVGALFFGETITPAILLGMAAVVGAVVTIVASGKRN